MNNPIGGRGLGIPEVGHPKAQRRNKCTLPLHRHGDLKIIEELLAAVKEGPPSVQWEAIHALGMQGDPKVCDPLLAILSDEQQHPLVRAETARVLGLLGEKSVLSILHTASKQPACPTSLAARITLAGMRQLDLTSRIDGARPWMSFSVPRKCAEMRRYSTRRENLHIFYINQLYYDDWGADWNAAAILESLISNYGVRLVGIEAGSGDDNLDYMRPDAPLWRRVEVTLEFWRDCRFAVENFVQLATDLDFSVWGVDDMDIYLKAVDEMRARRGGNAYTSKRAAAMCANLIAKMEENQTEVAALIAYPVLAYDIREQLERNGISYVEIVPRPMNWRKIEWKDIVLSTASLYTLPQLLRRFS